MFRCFLDFFYAIKFLVFKKKNFNLFSEFFNAIFWNFPPKKFELAREPISIGKIRVGDGTGIFDRITEHYELLDFELVSLDCNLIILPVIL